MSQVDTILPPPKKKSSINSCGLSCSNRWRRNLCWIRLDCTGISSSQQKSSVSQAPWKVQVNMNSSEFTASTSHKYRPDVHTRAFSRITCQKSIHPLTLRFILLTNLGLGVSQSTHISCLTHGSHPFTWWDRMTENLDIWLIRHWPWDDHLQCPVY